MCFWRLSFQFVVALMEHSNGLHALSEYVKREILVGRMDGVAFKTEAHENCFHAEHALEIADDGDAAAATHCQWAFAEGLRETIFCCAVGGDGDRADVALAAVERRDFYFDTSRRHVLNIVDEKL